MRVAVTGASGQLGSDLVRHLPLLGDFEVVPWTRDALDVTDREAVEEAVSQSGLHALINCAALTNVDRCEEEADLAVDVNAKAPYLLARAAARVNCRLVQVSTDFVFGGESAQPYDEDDCPAPINVYGASKLSGEQLALLSNPSTLVVRISSVFGTAGSRGKGGNFVETILARARAGEPLAVVDDIVMSPTYTVDVVTAMPSLLTSGATGVVHLANRGSCTWHTFATVALELAGINAPVEPVPSGRFPRPARRPANSSLTGSRLRRLTGQEMRPWREALAAYLEEKR